MEGLAVENGGGMLGLDEVTMLVIVSTNYFTSDRAQLLLEQEGGEAAEAGEEETAFVRR